jgi:hypothetical protein
MFEREARKEKNLEQIKKQSEQLKKVVPKENAAAKTRWEQRKAELISEVEVQFNAIMKKEEEQRMKDEFRELDSPRNKDKKEGNK